MPEVSACPELARYRQLASGAIAPEEKETLLQHLERCEACAQRVELLPNQDTLLELVRQAQTEVADADDDKIARLVERLSKLGPAASASANEESVLPSAAAAPTLVAAVAGNADTRTPDGANSGTGGNSLAQPESKDRELYDFLAPAEAADELGRLGHYRVLKVLGIGGMGVVFQADEPSLKRKVALKAMLPGLAVSESARQRFLHEAQAAAAIEHDHIVPIFYVGDDRGVPFLAMPLLQGESLEDRLQREEQLPLAEVLRIGREMADGLAAAHERGLIHRDIKPANVWLEGKKGRVKILDFGLACAAGGEADLKHSGAIAGTPAYMAPEQARGEAVDGRCDLFSLGCVLYRMGAGRPPFQGRDTVSTIMATALAQPSLPRTLNPNISPELEALILRLLAKEPGERPADAREVVETLASLERDQAAPSPAGLTALPIAAKRPRPSRWLLIGGAVVLLAAALLFAVRNKKSTEETWLVAVAAMPPEEQVAAVAARLQERNPGFDGKVTHTIEGNVVTELEFSTDHVTDLSSVRALTGLRVLRCSGSAPDKGQLADLLPLNGLSLTALDCHYTRVSDLSPLTGMPLTTLYCHYTQVSDLSPLTDMPLTTLDCGSTRVVDLSPLKNMKLMDLGFGGTKVSNMSPLKGMPLTKLNFWGTPVFDLSPLKGMPLTFLCCLRTEVQDLSPLRGMLLRTLFCGETAVPDLSPLEGMKLEDLRCDHTLVADLSVLHGMPLTWLDCSQTRVSDLSPLKGMKLTYLNCWGTAVFDLSPLKGMPLTYLNCYGTKVSNLSPLKGMPLTDLQCSATPVSDLSPLKDMKLTFLQCHTTRVSDLSPLKGMLLRGLACGRTRVTDLSALKGMPLRELSCDIEPERDAAILRTLKSLETVNRQPAAALWKDLDARAAKVKKN